MIRRNGNFIWIVLALMLLLAGIPVADEIDAISRAFTRAFTFSCLLGIGVMSLRGARRSYYPAIALAVVGIILNIIAIQSSADWLTYASFAAILLFIVIAIGVTFHDVATDPDISANRIIGAVAVYLLLGVFWAVAYTLVDLAVPGSFAGFESQSGTAWDSEWLYFSFVTMTTLGYGDISPVSPVARLLAYLQAIVGQLYIAILVAGLVGAYISRRD